VLYVGLQHSLSGNFSLHATPGGNTQINGASNGSTITVSPNQSTVYTIENVQIHDNGCPPIANGSGKVDLAPLAITAEAGQYNGVGVSCFGAADGFAEATVTGGFGPVDLLWSTNDQASNVTDLPAGTYQVTATDAEGCTDVAEVAITEPDLLAADWATFDIDCRPGSSGELELLTVQNGTGPYTILLNNEPAIPVGALPQNISGLPAGPLEISVVDANGCVVAGTETIHLPTPLTLDLGPDQSILTGDTALISSVITGNQPVSLVWTPVESLLSPQQLSTLANPLQTTTYTLSIEDAAGCTATDDITIRIKKTRRVYIPNVIKPDGDGDNAVITVFGGAEVKQVNYLSIYDRWGEHLFIAKNFAPNDPASGWDGRWRGKDMQPGVYVYVAEVAFLDGEVLLYKGSVTVLR
jgi:gliding motility-associated-like protein